MQTTYSTATVCGVGGTDACVPLDPDLTNIMADSRDYNDLRSAWKGWRDASGKTMRNDYNKYVGLMNEVATRNGELVAWKRKPSHYVVFNIFEWRTHKIKFNKNILNQLLNITFKNLLFTHKTYLTYLCCFMRFVRLQWQWRVLESRVWDSWTGTTSWKCVAGYAAAL